MGDAVRTARPARAVRPDLGRPRPRLGAPTLLVAGAVLAAASALVVFLLGVTNGFAAAVPLTSWLLPVAKLAMDLAAVGTIGGLLYVAVLVPTRSGPLAPAELRVVRVSARWAATLAVSALVTAVLTSSDISGSGLRVVLPPASLYDFLVHESHGRALLMVLVLAGCLAAAATRARSLADVRFLLVLALATVLPPTQTGHAVEEANHVLALGTLMVHVVAVCLWFGGLAALFFFGRGRSSLGAAVGRFSPLALGCFVAAGLTGAVNAWIRLGGGGLSIGELTGSAYGRFVAAKIVALVVLGGVGWWHRRRTLPDIAAGKPGAFGRFALGELVVMVLTVALAVALSRTPPPPLPEPTLPAVEKVQPHWPCSTDPVFLLRTEARSDVVRWARLCNAT